MENQKVSPGKFAMNYGALLGLILVVIAVIMYVTNMAIEGKQWPMYIYYLIFPIVIFIAVNNYKKTNGGFLTISEALKVGVAAAVISGIIYLLYNIIFQYIIEPGFAEQMLEASRDKMREMGNFSEDQIEQSMQWVKWATNPFLGGAIFIGFSAFFGLIYSLIAGAIMKNKNPYEA